jgi:hypothetical protein
MAVLLALSQREGICEARGIDYYTRGMNELHRGRQYDYNMSTTGAHATSAIAANVFGG